MRSCRGLMEPPCSLLTDQHYKCDDMTAGLVAVMLLLGFGLVRIPRSMLQEADPAARLAYAHHK